MDRDISKLSKIYEKLETLPKITNGTLVWINEGVIKGTEQIGSFIDEAVSSIFDLNKLVQISYLNTKNNKEEKLLALSSINLMHSIISSILSTIPGNYIAETKILEKSLFDESELKELGMIVTFMNKNKEIKCSKLKKNMNIIDVSFKSMNTSDFLKILKDLEVKNRIRMKNNICSQFSINASAQGNNKLILAKDLAREFLQDKNFLREISDAASNVASEITSDPSTSAAKSNESGSGSILDRKFGEVTLKQLIGAARR